MLQLPLFLSHGLSFVEEFAFLGRSVDLAGVSCVTSELFAVEVKVHDWKRVLWQARHCQVFADRVYVALWHARGLRAQCSFLRNSGIGLVLVDDNSAELIIKAEPSRVVNQAARSAAVAAIGALGS